MSKKQKEKSLNRTSLKNSYSQTLPVENVYGQRFYFSTKESVMIQEVKCIRNLIAAVLDRAALDLYDNVDRCIQRQADAWFHSKDESEWSLRWCLDKLDLNLEAGKQLYREAKEKRYARG